MTTIRSAAFTVLALLFSALMMVLLLPALVLPRKRFQRLAGWWCRGLLALLGFCCGLRWRLQGAENLPAGPAIIAAKHQSTWDTLIFHILLDDPIYVLKRELLVVPFLGWYLRKAGNIAIDRGAGFRAIRTMLPAVDRALAEGAKVIVFPEGTRTAPGERVPYQPGIAALYGHAGCQRGAGSAEFRAVLGPPPVPQAARGDHHRGAAGDAAPAAARRLPGRTRAPDRRRDGAAGRGCRGPRR